MLPLFAFFIGSLVVAAVAFLLMPARAGAIDRRLDELTTGREDGRSERKASQALLGLMKRVGEKAPRGTKELGPLRLRLVQAGFRRPEAITIFFGIRVMFAVG